MTNAAQKMIEVAYRVEPLRGKARDCRKVVREDKLPAFCAKLEERGDVTILACAEVQS